MITIHHDIKNFFSENEERLADFVATIAGAALENADGFAKLQTLNETLENRVVQRTADLQKRATELADAKKELEIAKSRAEQASEAKSSFLATMSHEIRTPMNAVIGMTELCLNTEMTPVQLDYLSVVKQSAKSLLRLLNDILDFSKVEANKLELEKVEFDLHSIVEESSQALNINAVSKNVEIICRISPDVPRKVVGDAGRFRQVLINLVGNAIKFTDEGEVFIDIQTRSCDDNTVQLHCSVNDTGIGIPAEYRASIFESFKQADSSTTRRYGGTGLGLAICSRLVGLMDGEIWIEGNGDRGTSFQFTPKFDKARSDSSSAASPGFLQDQRTAICTRFGHTALVVKEMVESAGGQVSIVTSLQEPQGVSLEKFDQGAANLVVFDLEYCEDGIGSLFDFAADRAKIADAKTIILYPANEAEICEQVDHPHVAFASKPLTRLKFESALSSLFGNDEKSSVEGSTIIGDTEVESMHILLAEDVKINQRVAGEMLKLMGHTVEFANNGVEALEKIQSEKFDVVLMDIEMPEMDGIEATRRVRELEKTTGFYQPVVAMTAHVVEKFQKECEQVGMDGYISKPIEPEQIAAELAKIAHGF
jgi:two-component system sensor kinase